MAKLSLRALTCGAVLTSIPALQAQTGTTAPYAELTNNFRDYTNFNVETVKGMVVTDAFEIYGLNTHASKIVRHFGLSGQPPSVWDTLNGPIAIALWNDQLVVVGGAAHALALHDRFTGEILNVMDLPNEPGDIVIDDVTNLAYVSSQGEHLVVEIDLLSFSITNEFALNGTSPRFLSLESDGDLTRVYAAPMIAGNATAPVRPPAAGGVNPSGPLEDATGAIFSLPWLQADEDLYEIVPSSGSVRAVVKAAGSFLLGHGRNPMTGEYWMVGFDADNAMRVPPTLNNPGGFQRTEAELKGKFGKNILSIIKMAPSASGVGEFPMTSGTNPVPDVSALRKIDLDLDGTGSYSQASAVSFPYDVEFIPLANSLGLGGMGLISSSTSDRISIHWPNGTKFATLQLPDGAIPRQVHVDPTGNFMFIYCWGTNEILVQPFFLPMGSFSALTLGVDPTPAAIQRGREIWYDASRSENGRFTCNSCHANQGTDALAWMLADGPVDYKDIMVTQTLRSIQDTPDYHWRGERSMRDFNGAFEGLLGSNQNLTATELDDFVEFIFSSQAHANPLQNENREVDSSKTVTTFTDPLTQVTVTSDALQGQNHFLNTIARPGLTCADCHSLPTGSMSFSMSDGTSIIPSSTSLDVAHLRQLGIRDRETVNGLQKTGFGITHDGTHSDLQEFISSGAFILTPQEAVDVTSFVKQFDQGISPAAHAAIRVGPVGTAAAASQVSSLLLAQADNDWIDVVAYRTSSTGQQERWLYDPNSQRFQPSFGGPVVQLSALVGGIATTGAIVFQGVPLGDGRRLAMDQDLDGLLRVAEATLGTDPLNPDSDGDLKSDGEEVRNASNPLSSASLPTDTTPPQFLMGFPKLDFVVAGAAKYFVETDEPVLLKVETSTAGGPTFITRAQVLSTRHTIVLDTFDPSTPGSAPLNYQATFHAIDSAGLSSTLTVSFTAENMLDESLVEIGALTWTQAPTLSQNVVAAEVLVESKEDAPNRVPVAGKIVVTQVLTRASAQDPWTTPPAASIGGSTAIFDLQVDPAPAPPVLYSVLPGPFVLSSLTDAAGKATVSFNKSNLGLGAGDHIRLNVLMVLDPEPNFSFSAPVFLRASINDWSSPTTKRELRGIEATL